MNMHMTNFRSTRIFPVIIGLFSSLLLMASVSNAYAAGTNQNYTAIPPLLLTGGSVPNILVILDNSNSMDEAADGHAVGSANSGSKSEIARNAVKSIVNSYTNKVRMGLMAYQQSGVTLRNLHDAWYDLSYDSANYDSNYDLSASGARDSTTKKFLTVSTSNGGVTRNIYYNVALPYYSGGNDGTAYCYSRTADFDNGAEVAGTGPWDFYRCFREKGSTSDVIPATNGAAETNEGYTSLLLQGNFQPTDSDYAQNILDFGSRLGWQYVSPAWFSNTSPGRGYVHTEIADLDSAHAATLNAKLATSQFATSTDTPLRNAGLTPLEGTLDTALNYFNGTALPSNEGGVTYTPPVSCSGDNYVILVTDGLPSTDASGNPYPDTATAITAVANKAAALNATGTKVYVVGFALPASVDPTILDTIASSGGTNTAFSASDSATLNSTLNVIFQDVLNRTSSGSAAAVVANSGLGTGAIYQALYNPLLTQNNTEVKWSGSLHSFFIDQNGYFREDTDGDDRLDDYTTDAIIRLTYDDVPGEGLKVKRFTSPDGGINLAPASPASVDIKDLNTIWNASDELANLDQSTIINQRTYATQIGSGNDQGRHILTNIGGVAHDFVWDSTPSASENKIDSTNYRYLGLNSASEAEKLVNFIRGKEGISGYRSRSLDSDNNGSLDERYLLGDIIHSNPVVVGAPKDGYDLRYRDSSYGAFRQRYAKRRQMVYVGGNDGMVHAFNAGFWNANNQSFDTSPTGGGVTTHPLGAEMWSFIPQNLLPHLQWLKESNYAHVFYMDGEPLVFDANIFANDSVHTNGWGTVLVIGMRLGGGAMTVDTDGDSTDDWTTASSYLVLDITDPESPPTLLAEITDTNLGFTTARPTIAKKRAASATGNWTDFTGITNEWYLVFGSGPGPNDSPINAQSAITDVESIAASQQARIYKYDLGDVKKSRAMGFASGYSGGKTTGVDWSFSGNASAVDWDNDYTDDAVYFGTVGTVGQASTQGGLYRLKLDDDTLPSLYNADKPVFAAPLLSIDNKGSNWIHVGSGRLLAASDNSTVSQQIYMGIKEPVVSNALSYADISASTPSSLQNITNIKVFTSGALSDPDAVLPLTTPTISTFKDLETYIEKYRAGWYREFTADGTDPSTRSLFKAARANRLLFYTDYTPSADVCSPEGDSRLNVVNLKTGVAEAFAPLGTDPGVTLDGAEESLRSISLGKGVSSAPDLHKSAGSDGITVITSTSTGTVTGTNVIIPVVTSGRQSWREILNE